MSIAKYLVAKSEADRIRKELSSILGGTPWAYPPIPFNWKDRAKRGTDLRASMVMNWAVKDWNYLDWLKTATDECAVLYRQAYAVFPVNMGSILHLSTDSTKSYHPGEMHSGWSLYDPTEVYRRRIGLECLSQDIQPSRPSPYKDIEILDGWIASWMIHLEHLGELTDAVSSSPPGSLDLLNQIRSSRVAANNTDYHKDYYSNYMMTYVGSVFTAIYTYLCNPSSRPLEKPEPESPYRLSPRSLAERHSDISEWRLSDEDRFQLAVIVWRKSLAQSMPNYAITASDESAYSGINHVRDVWPISLIKGRIKGGRRSRDSTRFNPTMCVMYLWDKILSFYEGSYEDDETTDAESIFAEAAENSARPVPGHRVSELQVQRSRSKLSELTSVLGSDEGDQAGLVPILARTKSIRAMLTLSRAKLSGPLGDLGKLQLASGGLLGAPLVDPNKGQSQDAGPLYFLVDLTASIRSSTLSMILAVLSVFEDYCKRVGRDMWVRAFASSAAVDVTQRYDVATTPVIPNLVNIFSAISGGGTSYQWILLRAFEDLLSGELTKKPDIVFITDGASSRIPSREMAALVQARDLMRVRVTSLILGDDRYNSEKPFTDKLPENFHPPNKDCIVTVTPDILRYVGNPEKGLDRALQTLAKITKEVS